MGTLSEDKIQDLLDLPARDRAEITLRLFDSICAPTASPLDPEWLEEIRRRVKEVKSGTADCIPIDDFMRDMRAQFL